MVKKATTSAKATKSTTTTAAKSAKAKKTTKAKKVDSKSILSAKEAFYAVLGLQKTAYDLSVEKFNELNDKRKVDVNSYIARGEEVEALFQDKYEEFKGQDSFAAKQVVTAEEQYKKIADKVSNISDKLTASVKKVQDKVKKAA